MPPLPLLCARRCCMHDPAARPQLSVVWADMHKLLQQVQAQQQLLSARG